MARCLNDRIQTSRWACSKVSYPLALSPQSREDFLIFLGTETDICTFSKCTQIKIMQILLCTSLVISNNRDYKFRVTLQRVVNAFDLFFTFEDQTYET